MAVAQKAKPQAKQQVKPPAKIVNTRSAAKPSAKAKPLRAKSKAVSSTLASTPAIVPKSPSVENNRQIAKAKAALIKESNEPQVVVSKAKSRPKAKARKILLDVNPNEAASALALKWATLYKKADQIDAKPYNMKAAFEEKTAIMHKLLGWGYILTNRNDRLEVLFKDGIKYLISNYKP